MNELERLLEFEERLRDELLPEMRERAHARDLRVALDRHLLETEEHVSNLRRVPPLELPRDDDFALLAEIFRVEHAELAAYEFLVQSALALGLDDDAVRRLRLNMEQDAYALEQAEHALAKLLAEKVTARR